MIMIRRAVDGGDSCLNENLFCEANIGVGEGIEIGTEQTLQKWPDSSAIIVFSVVLVDRRYYRFIHKLLLDVYGNGLEIKLLDSVPTQFYAIIGDEVVSLSKIVFGFGIFNKAFHHAKHCLQDCSGKCEATLALIGRPFLDYGTP
ncbi:hypothetical protein SUGI_0094790 [Cryptomeria japonica]|nr:hypothetical protein SUGI_0094790 [Cryptomeria japonica]